MTGLKPDAQLIETFRWEPECGPCHLEDHLARLTASSHKLGYPFEREQALRLIERISGQAALRCRLTLTPAGALDLITASLGQAAELWHVAVHEEPLKSDALWLRHKTTDRPLYDKARAELPSGLGEWLFLNENGFLCEGTITNLFVPDVNGILRTPPLEDGLLPGTLRQRLLREGRAREARLTLTDLRDAEFFMGNNLRGLIPSRLIA